MNEIMMYDKNEIMRDVLGAYNLYKAKAEWITAYLKRFSVLCNTDDQFVTRYCKKWNVKRNGNNCRSLNGTLLMCITHNVLVKTRKSINGEMKDFYTIKTL